MASGDGLTVRVQIEGIRETLAAFRRLGPEASDAIRTRAGELAATLAGEIEVAGRSEGSQAALVAMTVKARRDRVPVVQAGGSKRVGSRRASAGALIFGAEFGSNRYRQFKPHQGAGSYWFYKTIDARRQEIARAWSKAADDILRTFAAGGGG